jgi:hypothetical protein
MKFLATRKAQQNRAAVDPWTAVHVAAGLAAGLKNIPLRWTLGVGVAYEVAEQVFERSPAGQELFETSGPERVPNALFDLAVLIVGHRLGQWWNRT